MPEGRLGAWRWMLRRSDARRSTYRGAGVGVTLVRDRWSTSLSVSVDAWWAGVLLEIRREAPRPVYDRHSLVARERAEAGLCPWTTANVSCGGRCLAVDVCGRPAWRQRMLSEAEASQAHRERRRELDHCDRRQRGRMQEGDLRPARPDESRGVEPVTDLLRVAVDFEREHVTRWLADPPWVPSIDRDSGNPWRYVERVEDAGVFPRAQAVALWREYLGRSWRREFARTEEVE